ncbi:HNH endonuclease [Pectobacterium phage vB_PatM_CB7]|nr:HNH endonuclease [Pectobacterium phage vB_PatM_CB7]
MLNWDDYFRYDQRTGILYWKVKRPNGISAGDVAGRKDKKRGYIHIWLDGQLYLGHRVAWEMNNGPTLEGRVIDHLNHVPWDNRLPNLRMTTQLSNTRNNKRSSRNKSGVTGVMWREKEGKWLASITVDRKRIYLGRFIDKDEAIRVRKEAEKLYGFHENHGKGEV